ncbi:MULTISPECIES: hypothetical protein [Xanthomonas]|uniref:hypothetical protein n=1 Tax=Xanthomonas TaxID=338 RepID=UPI0018842ADE|nr:MULTISPECIES: hypothetical protein [Xanthomonas]QOX05578.1 hypothetical protein IG630_23100 [Xanthomonas sp. WG16]QXF04370.1 hypothetical protein KJA71_23115 [Xanthomonas citri pv. citri]
MSIDVVAQYLTDVWAGVETQAQVNELTRSFSFPHELQAAVQAAMADAAEQDAASPADPTQKWRRAANIVNALAERWALARELRLTPGDWSWCALLQVVGVEVER